jgi:tetratricopeptide (TPR) repeat protein
MYFTKLPFFERERQDMKSKERHELKENELAEWFVNLPVWFEKNRNTVIYVSTSIIILGVLWFWYRYQKNVIEPRKYQRFTETLAQLQVQKPRILQANLQQMDATSNLRALARDLQDLADTTKNAKAAALAYIEQAKILRTDIHYRLKSPDKSQLAEQINKAKEAYSNALAKLEAPPAEKGKPLDDTLAAEAIFGIGLCEEELGNFDAARKKYMEITTNPAYQYTTTFVEAQRRLDIMADFEKAVAFKPEPVPPVQQLTQPMEMTQPLPVGSEPNLVPVIMPVTDKNSPNVVSGVEPPVAGKPVLSVVERVEPNKP